MSLPKDFEPTMKEVVAGVMNRIAGTLVRYRFHEQSEWSQGVLTGRLNKTYQLEVQPVAEGQPAFWCRYNNPALRLDEGHNTKEANVNRDNETR